MTLHPITQTMREHAEAQAKRHRATIDIEDMAGAFVRLDAYAPPGQLWKHSHRPWIRLEMPHTGAAYSLLIEAMAKGTYVPE